MNDDIIDPEELREARKEGLQDVELVVKQFAKRASSPAKRVAMGEMEETLRRVREDWRKRGLVA